MITPVSTREARRGHVLSSLLPHHNSSLRSTGMASSVAAMPERITALLVREGIVTRELLERAQRDAKQNGTTITLALIRTGAISEVELTKIIAQARTRCRPSTSRKFEVDPEDPAS